MNKSRSKQQRKALNLMKHGEFTIHSLIFKPVCAFSLVSTDLFEAVVKQSLSSLLPREPWINTGQHFSMYVHIYLLLCLIHKWLCAFHWFFTHNIFWTVLPISTFELLKLEYTFYVQFCIWMILSHVP